MGEIGHTTARIQSNLGRIADGEGRTFARDELLDSAIRRIRQMVRKEIARSPGVTRWEEEDDLVQEVLIRVDRAVQDAQPEHVGQFFLIVGQHVRWAAVDMIRKHFGSHGLGRNYRTNVEPAAIAGQPVVNPDVQIDSVKLHEAVDRLDDELKDTWILHVYSGLRQEAIAELLKVSTKTVQRRIARAKLRLAEMLEPGES